MGIQGLLGVLKPLIKECHVEQFRGKRVAVDGYCWLHKATYSCSIDLCNGVDNQAWIKYFLNMVDMLVYHDIEVYIVFDGKNLPAKQLVEASRGSSRQANLQKAREFEAAQDMKNAYIYYSRAVNVTPAMAARLIKIMKSSHPKVQCIVAPYEADAQLSYLSINNIVDLIISEDSDHIPYGCKDILFKLDGRGNCQRLLVSDLYSVPLDGFDLRNFTPEMTLIMCIISGCDYLNSVKGVGLKNSYKLVSKQRNAGSVLRNMRITGLLPLTTVHDSRSNYSDIRPELLKLLPSNLLVYEFEFYKALTTFHHQAIYDPVLRKIKHISPIVHSALPQCLQIAYPSVESSGSSNSVNSSATATTIIDVSLSEVTEIPQPSPLDLPFLGSILVSDEVAVAIAEGLIDPTTKEPFDLPEYLERPLSRNGSTGSLQTLKNNSSSSGSSGGSSTNSIKKSTTLPSHVTSYQSRFNQFNNRGSSGVMPSGGATVASGVSSVLNPHLTVAEAHQMAAATVSFVNKLKSEPTVTPQVSNNSSGVGNRSTSATSGGSVGFGSAQKAMLPKASSSINSIRALPSSSSTSAAAKKSKPAQPTPAAAARKTVTPSSNGAASYYSYDSNGIAISTEGNKRKGTHTINSFFSKSPKVDSSTPSSKGPSCISGTGGTAFVTPTTDSTPAATSAAAVNEFDIYSVITIHSSASNSPIVESRRDAHSTNSGRAPLHPNRSAHGISSHAASDAGDSIGVGARVSPYFAKLSASESLKKLNTLKVNQAQLSLDHHVASPEANSRKHTAAVQDVIDLVDLTPLSDGTTQESAEECSFSNGDGVSTSSAAVSNGFVAFGYDDSFSPPVPANKLRPSAVIGLTGVDCNADSRGGVDGKNSGSNNPFDMFQCG